jgi:hypothetical protein
MDTATDTNMDLDMGVAVSREEVMASIEQEGNTAAHDAISSLPRKLPVQLQRERNRTSSRQTSTAADAKADVAASKETKNSTDVSAAGLVKSEKAQEKKRVGDEFDDIFRALDKSSSNKKAPKKKKRKKGDEFDDIFGGLS